MENSPNSKTIFILAGEHSGDLLGGPFIDEFNLLNDHFSFFGIGGDQMIRSGMESLYPIESLSIMGFWEALKQYKKLKSIMDGLVKEIVLRKPRLAILIDSPGFNLRLAKILKEFEIPVIYYVSPQLWAWKEGRIETVKKYVSLMLTLFKFEKEFYDKHKVNAQWVGHPLSTRIETKLSQEITPERPKTNYTIGLLPGSRKSEIHHLLPELLKSAKIIYDHFSESNKSLKFIVPNINQKEEEYIQSSLNEFKSKYPEIPIFYYWDASLSCMNESDILLIASGTAVLEGVYFAKPMVVVYKLSYFTYYLGSLIIKTANVSLVNILGKEEICRELLQSECNPTDISKEAIRILENKPYRDEMVQKIKEVRKELGKEDSSKKAARAVFQWMESKGLLST